MSLGQNEQTARTPFDLAQSIPRFIRHTFYIATQGLLSNGSEMTHDKRKDLHL
jgi:hypothetical protein